MYSKVGFVADEFYIIFYDSNVITSHTQLCSMPVFPLNLLCPFPEECEQEQLYWSADFFVAVPDRWWWHKQAVLRISHKLKLGRLSYTEEASKHQKPKIGRRRRRVDWSGSEALDLDSRLNINCCECKVGLNQLKQDRNEVSCRTLQAQTAECS